MNLFSLCNYPLPHCFFLALFSHTWLIMWAHIFYIITMKSWRQSEPSRATWHHPSSTALALLQKKLLSEHLLISEWRGHKNIGEAREAVLNGSMQRGLDILSQWCETDTAFSKTFQQPQCVSSQKRFKAKTQQSIPNCWVGYAKRTLFLFFLTSILFSLGLSRETTFVSCTDLVAVYHRTFFLLPSFSSVKVCAHHRQYGGSRKEEDRAGGRRNKTGKKGKRLRAKRKVRWSKEWMDVLVVRALPRRHLCVPFYAQNGLPLHERHPRKNLSALSQKDESNWFKEIFIQERAYPPRTLERSRTVRGAAFLELTLEHQSTSACLQTACLFTLGCRVGENPSVYPGRPVWVVHNSRVRWHQ